MAPIFISYRRDDGVDTAQLLQMHLINMFGEDAVFLDTTTMKPGQEFPTELHNAVSNSKIVIAMIGPNWKGTDPQINRLNNEKDWVRKELEIALSDKKKKIFPVLVKGTTSNKSFTDLPSSIDRLATFNSSQLREKEFKVDLLPLIPLIEPYLELEDPLKELPLNEDKYVYPESPYKGLDYFKEEDSKIFFGRGQEIRKLYNKIKNRNILFLYGQSGSGKSSLLFAGLKPRVEFKGWAIKYYRRETGINLAKKLNEYLQNAVDDSRQLVILDQVEEIFTNPHSDIPSDEEAQQLLSVVKNASLKIHVILSFRKEFLAEFRKLFAGLPIEDFFLEPLQTTGVLEATRGITKSDEARDNYELRFIDEEVPMAIAQSVLSDEESYVAPLLQVILRKMWDKVENKKPRIFSKELLEEVRSNNLVTFINGQILTIKEKFEVEVSNGLVHDVLYYFTTTRSTSASHSKEELKSNYVNSNILRLANELKNKYLLSEPKQDDAGSDIIRLAHDSLAPLIRELFAKSNLPGQRALRLLESKRGDIESDYEVEFSKADITILDSGESGMRKWTEKEKVAIERSRLLIQKNALDLEEKSRQILSSTIVAKLRAVLPYNSTLALRLAEAACKITKEPLPEAQLAFQEIINSSEEFCKIMIPHSAGVLSVAFSPDGKFILTGGNDAVLNLWTLDGKIKQVFKGHRHWVKSVAFSPNENLILSSSIDETVRLWNMNGEEKKLLKIRNENITIAFAPDNNSIFMGGAGNVAKLLSVGGKVKQIFKGHTSSVFSVCFSPDGKLLLTGSGDKTARLWSLDGKVKKIFKGHTDMVNSVAFSPDGRYVISGSDDGTARLWSIDGKIQQIFDSHKNTVHSVAFSPNGKWIATAGDDGTVRIWNLKGKMENLLKCSADSVYSVAFSPDSKLVVAGLLNYGAQVWNVGKINTREIKWRTKEISSAVFSPNSEYILTSGSDKTTRILDLDGNMRSILKGHTDEVTSAVFSLDGEMVLTGSLDNTVKVWENNGKLVNSFSPTENGIYKVSFLPDGKKILVVDGRFADIGIWTIEGIRIQQIKVEKNNVMSTAFSSNGKYFLTGSYDGNVSLFTIDGKRFKILKTGKSANIDAAAFDDSGTKIAVSTSDSKVIIWDIISEKFNTIDVDLGNISSVSFSPGGKFILVAFPGDDEFIAQLWSIDGELRQVFKGKSAEEGIATFSPDSKWIVTNSQKNSMLLWKPFWEMLDPNNTAVLTNDIMKEYGIPENIEWGKLV